MNATRTAVVLPRLAIAERFTAAVAGALLSTLLLCGVVGGLTGTASDDASLLVATNPVHHA